MPDAYTRKARLAPGALVAIPGGALLLAGALSPETELRSIGMFLGALGILLAVFIRDSGRRIQPALWDRWGGPPTQVRLRWRDGGSAAAVERLHSRLEAITGAALPDAAAEAADSADAERRYTDAVNFLKENTRKAEEFPLVAAENADYGFRRNTLSLRQLGLAVSLVGLAIAAGFVIFGSGTMATRAPRWGSAAGVCVLCLLFWWFLVNEKWVRRAAENYADRLLGAIDILSPAAAARSE